VRDLCTQFPRLKRLVEHEHEGEVVVTDRGKPAFVLRAYRKPATARTRRLDDFARLKARPAKPLSAAAARGLDESDRGER